MRCHLDIETYSEDDLKAHGVYVYAEHHSTEVQCVVFRFGDEAPELWIPPQTILNNPEVLRSVLSTVRKRQPTLGAIHLGPIPERLRKYIEDGGEVAAHNAQFERIVLNGPAGRRIGFPHLKIEQMVCTAAKSRMHGLPGELGGAAEAMGTHPKDESGKMIMLQLCRPRTGKVKRYLLAEEPEKYAHLYAYCVDDVLAESDLDKHLADLTESEQRVWVLDQLINDRGVHIDVPMIHIVRALIEEYKAELEAECLKRTVDEFSSPVGLRPSQREKIADWCRQYGYPQLVDMTADTVKYVLKDPACPDDVKMVLRIYNTYGMTSVSKFGTMLDAMGANERIRGMFMYYGAGTGRWSSKIVQLQNLFRPVISDCDTAIEAFKSRDLSLVKFLYDSIDPMKVFASCIRGMLIARPGYTLQAIDFAGIESRVLAWLFGEEWKLVAFRASDADPEQPDNYELAYAMCFGVSPYEVTKGQRQVGKPIDLGLGYEGGANAFITMAATYNVDLEDIRKTRPNIPAEALEYGHWMWENIECKRGNSTELDYELYTTIEGLKYQWRAGHPSVKQGWKDILQAAKLAVLNAGQVYKIPNGLIMFQMKDKWLRMRLPSGRKLEYFKPELKCKEPKWVREERVKNGGDADDIAEIELKYLDLTYMGMDTVTRRWMRTGTYGGKLTENAVQAIAGDLLRGAMFRSEDAGYPIVMTVHDEVVSEIPLDFGSLHAAEKIMCVEEEWAAGLPINAEGFRAKRFRK